MRVSANEWNEFVDGIFRSRLMSVFSNRLQKWRHPWSTEVVWNAALGQFAAKVKPGFCLADGTVEVSARGVDGAEVRLSDDPLLPIAVDTWRAIGTDALSVNGSAEMVPDFFRRRGVVDAVDFSVDENGVSQSAVDFGVDRSQARLLRACELVIYHDRLETATGWAEGDGGAEFGVVLTAPPNMRPEAYVRILSRYEERVEVDPRLKMMGDWVGENFDDLHIATLYLLSPPGWTRGDPDDQVWQGFVRNSVYWNLQYWQKRVEPPPAPERLRLAGRTLGGGAVGAVGDPRLAIINDEFARLSAFLSGAEASGRFFSM